VELRGKQKARQLFLMKAGALLIYAVAAVVTASADQRIRSIRLLSCNLQRHGENQLIEICLY
jgi:hypothetical protein